MNVIRKMQEERQLWESEKDQLQETNTYNASELKRLQAEVEQLRSAPPAAASNAPPPVVVTAPVQAHHSQQLKLMETIDELRRDLQSEQERSQRLESCVNIGGGGGGDRLGVTGQLDQTLASAMRATPAHEDFASLEDENLQLREELNASKEKVIELKRAAAKRSADWRTELHSITEELGAKQTLEEEAATLRTERSQMQEQLLRSETAARAAIERLREELLQSQQRGKETATSSKKADEMEKLSQTMSRRICELEEELARKVGEHSHLLSLFLKHAERPVEALRLHCTRMVGAGEEIPNSFVPDGNDFQQSLVNIIEMLRWAEEVTDNCEDVRPKSSEKQRRSGYAR